jgi:hypothetical protein
MFWVWFSLLFVLAIAWPKFSEEVQLRFYTAPAKVILLANDTQMTDKARRIFYLAQPTVHPGKGNSCNIGGDGVVLGCYSPAKNRIFIEEVEDVKLDGVTQVTAAHEMLHAVYHRLPAREKQDVDRELATVFAKTTDQRLIETIASYRKRDPRVVPNELHSFLGTEVASLSPFLDNYYQQYFKDRSAVVKYAQQFSKNFDELEAEADVLFAKFQVLERELKELAAANRKENLAGIYNQKVNEYREVIKRYNDLVRQARMLNRALGSKKPIEPEED